MRLAEDGGDAGGGVVEPLGFFGGDGLANGGGDFGAVFAGDKHFEFVDGVEKSGVGRQCFGDLQENFFGGHGGIVPDWCDCTREFWGAHFSAR